VTSPWEPYVPKRTFKGITGYKLLAVKLRLKLLFLEAAESTFLELTFLGTTGQDS
jgi:hypothetical protein